MSDPNTFPAFLQAIGVVAVYALFKDLVPRIMGRNGKFLSVDQHDKECKMKLTPIKEKVDQVHKDLRYFMKYQGVNPDSADG